MKKTSRSKAASAESIARKAERGKDVSRYFANRGKMMQPIQAWIWTKLSTPHQGIPSRPPSAGDRSRPNYW